MADDPLIAQLLDCDVEICELAADRIQSDAAKIEALEKADGYIAGISMNARLIEGLREALMRHNCGNPKCLCIEGTALAVPTPPIGEG